MQRQLLYKVLMRGHERRNLQCFKIYFPPPWVENKPAFLVLFYIYAKCIFQNAIGSSLILKKYVLIMYVKVKDVSLP